jgi:hypothetical protein
VKDCAAASVVTAPAKESMATVAPMATKEEMLAAIRCDMEVSLLKIAS